jgi:hypothetical protein
MAFYDQVLTGATPESASSGNVAAGTAAASFAAATDVLNYLSGFVVTGSGATGASVVNFTITGLLGGTQTYNITVPAGATTTITPLVVTFPDPIQATAKNVAIAASLPTLGAGNTNASVNIFGYRLKRNPGT